LPRFGKRVWLPPLVTVALASLGIAVPAEAATTTRTITVTASADAYVSETAPTTAEGTADPANCFVNDDAGTAKRCMATFTVAGIGAGDSVTGAEFRIVDKGNAAGSKPVNLSNVSSAWNEATVTWNTRPSLADQVSTQSSHVFGADSVFSLDPGTVTSDGTYSFAMWSPAGSYDTGMNFYPKENTAGKLPPRLVLTVEHTDPPQVAWGMSMNQGIGGSGQTWNQARAVYDSTYGDATHKPIQRSFISGMPSAGNWGNVAPTDRSAVVSFRTTDFAGVIAGNYDTQLTAFFQAAPAPSTGFTYWYSFFHEMENNVTTATAKTQYISAARHVVTLQRTVAPRSNLIPTEIYSDFTLDASSGRNWLDWYWGDSFVDVVAWDQYNYQNADGTLNTEATKQANRASVAASHSHNDAYAVAEFPLGGSKFEDPVTGGDTVRAQWLRDTTAAYANNGAVFVTAFDTNVGGTFAIEGHPAIVSAWRDIVTAA
jgi:hypothetical protein